MTLSAFKQSIIALCSIIYITNLCERCCCCCLCAELGKDLLSTSTQLKAQHTVNNMEGPRLGLVLKTAAAAAAATAANAGSAANSEQHVGGGLGVALSHKQQLQQQQ
jgi:hypothetical protein